ncbi:MAG: type VI secretion system tip protein TssI/VgrG [Pirellulales bacterium]
MSLSQQSLPIGVTSKLGDDKLLVTRVAWTERLGAPFAGELELLSEADAIDLGSMLQSPIAVRIDNLQGLSHWLHGFICRFENLGPAKRWTRYRAEVVPAFGLLNATGGCRIFQSFSVIDIVKKIFAGYGFSGQLEDRTTGVHAPREYCVQYGESDFHFISRLLEEEGITYFFEYAERKHTMILADDLSAHHPAPDPNSIAYRENEAAILEEALTGLRSAARFGTGSVSLDDYDFTKPKAALAVKQNSAKLDQSFEWYEYPGRYSAKDAGQVAARIRQESVDAARLRMRMNGNVRGLRAGQTFKLTDHPTDAFNQDYLVTETTITLQAAGFESDAAGDFSYDIAIEVQPTSIPFRTPPETPRPIMRGPQTAVVCGKAGEEIWTDQYGRVKVQFPWDRDGKNDEQSSCWIRVAQSWGGKNWGSMCLPRIGEEVIVEFLDGDPDRPLITGRVFNADRMPPESLSSAQAKTVFRTRSTKGGDATTFHELTFDDTKDLESIYFHSERDFQRVVENNDTLKVGFDKKSPGDQTIEIYNDQKLTIGVGSSAGSQTIEISKNRSVTVDQGNDTLTVKQGDLSVKVSAGKAEVEAAKSITLKCGGSQIELTPSGIQITAPAVTVKADGNLSMHGACSTLEADGELKVHGALGNVQADAQLTLKGALVMIN